MARIACCQLDVVKADFEANKRRFVEVLGELQTQGVELAIFPECFLTGYAFNSHEEADSAAINRSQAAELQSAVDETGILAIVGFAEKVDGGMANSAVLLEPETKPRFFRKVHLPHIGLDRFVTGGDELPVFETRLGRIGILICFDQRHPEGARTLVLKGADLICLPTNWPEGAEMSAHYIAPARAAENRVCYATCNRAGSEGGFNFIGGSALYEVSGKCVAKAEIGSTILIGELDLMSSRKKRTVVKPGEYEWTMDESRRPELYGALVEPLRTNG